MACPAVYLDISSRLVHRKSVSTLSPAQALPVFSVTDIEHAPESFGIGRSATSSGGMDDLSPDLSSKMGPFAFPTMTGGR